MKKILFHALGISMMLVSGLLATELILRVRDEGGIKGAWDTMTAEDVPATHGTPDSEIVADPILGFRYNPARPEVNSLGIRNEEIPLEKPQDRKRLLVIGDSVSIMCDWTYDPEKGWVPFLRNKLAGRAEVINGAVSGFTVYQERLMLEHYLLPYEPDIVILQYTLNDNERFLHRFDNDLGLLITEEARRAYLPQEGDPLGWLPDWSYLAVRLRLLILQYRTQTKWPWNKHPGFKAAWQDESWDFFEEQLLAIKEMVEGVGGRMMVLIVPFPPQLRKDLLEEDRSYVLKPQTKMAEVCSKHAVPLLDVFEPILEAGGEKLYYDKVHLTSEGHQIVAALVAEKLLAHELLAPRPRAKGSAMAASDRKPAARGSSFKP